MATVAEPNLQYEITDDDNKNTEPSDVGLLKELYSQILEGGRMIDWELILDRDSRSLLGEGLSQLSLWQEFFPGDRVDELPSNDDFSYLDRSALKLLFEAATALYQILLSQNYNGEDKDHSVEWNRYSVLLDKVGYLVSQSSDSDEDSDDNASAVSSDSAISTELSTTKLISLFCTYSRCLMRLGPSIQEAYAEEPYEGEETPAHRDQTFKLHGPAAAYVSLIMDRFRTPVTSIAERLGEANWQRSERIRLNVAGDEPVSAEKFAQMTGVAPSSLFAPTSAFQDSALGSSLPASGQYAASFVTTLTAQTGDALRVPPTPKEVKASKPFKCSFCNKIVRNVNNRMQWKLHVYTDLEPYVCCVNSCHDLITFRTRDQWLDHTFRQHSLDEIAGSDPANTSLVKPKSRCPLCQTTIELTRSSYGRHVGRHLETIALASIPKEVDSDDESNDDVDSEVGSELSLHDVEGSSNDLGAPPEITMEWAPQVPMQPLTSTQPDVGPSEPFRERTSPEMPKTIQLLTEGFTKPPATFQCHLCPKRFTRAYNLRAHLRTHGDERPFVCTVCGKAFARQHDRERHEGLHYGEKKFVCKGVLKPETGVGGTWGCGRRFARADALGRHFRSEAGRACIKPLLDEETRERQAAMMDQQTHDMIAAQQQQHNTACAAQQQQIGPADGFEDYSNIPAALLQQHPALAGIQWDAPGGSAGSRSFEADEFGGIDFAEVYESIEPSFFDAMLDEG